MADFFDDDERAVFNHVMSEAAEQFITTRDWKSEITEREKRMVAAGVRSFASYVTAAIEAFGQECIKDGYNPETAGAD